MKKGQKLFELVPVPVKEVTKSAFIDKSRLHDLVRLIDEIKELDVTDKEQRKKCNTLLFRISWLVAELPRPLKFNSASPLAALGARNWVVLDYLSIVLKMSETGGCQAWTEGQYVAVIGSLMGMNRYFVKCLNGEKLKNVDTEYEGLEDAVGDQLNKHCMALACDAIQTASNLSGDQYQDDLTLFRTICIIGEIAKIISPALREKIIAIFGKDSKILTHLTSLRDLIVHDKYSTMEVLKSDNALRDRIFNVVLPFLELIFDGSILKSVQKPNSADAAIAALAEFRTKIEKFETDLKASEANPPAPAHLNLFVKLLQRAVSFINQCQNLEEFVERIIADRAKFNSPDVSSLSDVDIRRFFLWKRHRLISFHALKKILLGLDNPKEDASQAKRRLKIYDYFNKIVVTRQENDECTEVVDELSLLSESSRKCLVLFIKGKQVGVRREDNFEARKELIFQALKLRGESPYQDYLEYIDFISGDKYKACVGKRTNSTSMIDHKLYLECFPKQAQAFISGILTCVADIAPEEFLMLICFSENFLILDQVLDDDEYHARAYHFMFTQAIPVEKRDQVYQEIRIVSAIPGLDGTEKKRVFCRAIMSLVKSNPPIVLSNKERKGVGQLLDSVKFVGDGIYSDQIQQLQKSLESKYIDDKEVLNELTVSLVGCDKETCRIVLEEAIIRSKSITQLEVDIPWEHRGKRANMLYVELLSQVKLAGGKTVKDSCGDELLRLVKSDTESSCELVMEQLFSKCNTLTDTFLAYHQEKDTARRSKLRLVTEYLVEDLGETAEGLAEHPKFSDSVLYEVSKRNLLLISFIRKCIAHYPLSVNNEWFDYLIMLFSFGMPDRLNQYLRLSEAELWDRIFQPSRRVDISEFRENTERTLDFQMLVEQCGYNPIVRILNTPIGVMSDLNVVVEPNSTNNATFWDQFELELMLGHLINANVRVESTQSFLERSRERVLDEDLKQLARAESLPELVMKDTIRSLLKEENYSALGCVGRSDMRMLDILLDILKLMMMDDDITKTQLMDAMSDKNNLRRIILRFFTIIKRQSSWERLEKWSELVLNYIIMPSILGCKPVDVRMARSTVNATAILNDSSFQDFQRLPSMKIGAVEAEVAHCYVHNPDGSLYKRIDNVFGNLENTLSHHDVNSLYIVNIIDTTCRFLWDSRPAIVELVANIQNIESVTTVDRVRDQKYLTEHYKKSRVAKANRLQNRADIRKIIHEQAGVVGKVLVDLINSCSVMANEKWGQIKEVILIGIEINASLDAYFIEHEEELTRIYQSMDEGERSAYGKLISAQGLIYDLHYECHVTTKYNFRVLGRVPHRFTFPQSLSASLEREADLLSALSIEPSHFAIYRKLMAILNNFSRLSLVMALFDGSSTDVVSRELEALFQDQYCDETELPISLHFVSPPQQFEDLHRNVEHIAFLGRVDSVRELSRTAQENNVTLVQRVFQEDLSVCNLVKQGPPLPDTIELPPIFNGIVGYASELDGGLSQLHSAIAGRKILMMPTRNNSRVDLIRFLADQFDSPQEFHAQIHSTMAFYEWSTSTIEDLFIRYGWTEDLVIRYKTVSIYREHERSVQEYYEYRKHYDDVKSYQARAAHYTRKIKELNRMIIQQRVMTIEAGDNNRILFLQNQLDQYKRAYQLNRSETTSNIKTLMETNFVKRRMLKCIQLPIVIGPMMDNILSCPSDKNEYADHRISQLLETIRNQIDREIREVTNFSLNEEQQFDAWMVSDLERLPLLRSSYTQRGGRFRYNFLPGPEFYDTASVPVGSLDFSEAPSASK